MVISAVQGVPVLRQRALALRVLAVVTTSLSAFLLFEVQPMIAKLILPWFGGSAAVWTTALVFFQVMLLLGYFYAHGLTRRFRPPQQLAIHAGLLAVSLLALPVLPNSTWRPAGSEDPVWRILGLLLATVGLPYFMLAATSPLVQAWLGRGEQLESRTLYRYYALSNVASLVALLAYPVVIEPWFSGRSQAWVWSGAYVVFAVFCLLLGRKALAGVSRAAEPKVASPVSAARQAQWLVLAFLASALSLAVTNHLCMNVAAIPFLWVLPLGLYLCTLILCFDSDRWYRRSVLLPLHALAMAGAAWALANETPSWSVRIIIPVFAAALFTGCFFLHGELALRRPAPAQLTRFYLIMSLGGALGALVVALGAPYLLQANHELPLTMIAVAMATLFLEYRRSLTTDLCWTVVAVAVLVWTSASILATESSARVRMRNFYGALRIVDTPDRTFMVHGVVSHGMQFRQRPRLATSYYGPGSGVEQAFREQRTLTPGRSLRIGVIGLGAGTLAAYGQPGDWFRFYELNPQVSLLAQRDFRYLQDTPARWAVTMGDGRLSLEREPAQRYDLLVVDAFSGDSVPVHLLSVESMAVYRRHLAEKGWLALHVSNSVLDLVPVARTLDPARSIHLHVEADDSIGRAESDWVLIGDFPQALRHRARPSPGSLPQPWTDDHHNLFGILK